MSRFFEDCSTSHDETDRTAERQHYEGADDTHPVAGLAADVRLRYGDHRYDQRSGWNSSNSMTFV